MEPVKSSNSSTVAAIASTSSEASTITPTAATVLYDFGNYNVVGMDYSLGYSTPSDPNVHTLGREALALLSRVANNTARVFLNNVSPTTFVNRDIPTFIDSAATHWCIWIVGVSSSILNAKLAGEQQKKGERVILLLKDMV
ncbi:hypothetical protein GYMLUDRAFT_251225 [Collybiopsis luxurians FD-317 M1]|uniref:Uncharacterized protein n=1 Tax=Collybiopsis luxurians FD-317 M1 TaxID=944289 RepID=A0A0D0AQ15_9AGAR|nr:hypothetical protein GYMLUDRAFT_251225 [Collybiopsis luxurians FD-317 M1]